MVQYKRVCCTQGDRSLNEELYKEQLEERKKDGQSKLSNFTVCGTDTSYYFQLLNQISILYLKTISNYCRRFSPGRRTRRFSVWISFVAHGFRGIRGHRLQGAHEQVAVSSLKSKEDVFFPCVGGLPLELDGQRKISGLHKVQGFRWRIYLELSKSKKYYQRPDKLVTWWEVTVIHLT